MPLATLLSLRAVQTEYEALAGHYDERWADYVSASTALAESRLSVGPHARVLDVGCGTGVLLQHLHDRSPDLTLVGLDATPGMLARARARLGARPLLVEGSGDALPLDRAAVDAVVSTSALHYIADVPRTLSEMRRVLVPGGQLVIVDWCADFFTMRALDLVLRVTDRAHERTLGSRALQSAAIDAKFTNVQVTKARIDRFWGLMVLSATAPT